MAEKTFGIDLEESLHEQAKKLAIDRKVPVKRLYAEAIAALLAARAPHVPEKPRPVSPFDRWHRMLDEILESGDREAISAVEQNIVVFHRIVGTRTTTATLKRKSR